MDNIKRKSNQKIARNQTESKRAEEALRQSEERYRNLVESTSDYIWETNAEGMCTYANPRIYDILGYRPEEVIGKTPFDLMPPAEVERVLPIFQQAVSQRSPIHSLEYMIYHKDGHLVFLENNGAPFYNSEGILQGYRGNNRDITQRKRMEEEVRKACKEAEKRAQEVSTERQRLFNVLDTLPTIICLFTPDYHIKFANRLFREVYGEPGNRFCYEYFGFSEPCKFCETHEVLKTGRPHHWEITIPDGNILDAYDFPFTDTDGSPLILEMDIDITERKLAEEALRESEEFRRTLLENSSYPLIVRDKNEKLIYVNPAFEKLTGFSRAEVIGTAFPPPWWPEKEMLGVYAEHRNQTRDSWITIEAPLKKKNSEIIWTEVSSGPILRDSQLKYRIANWVDITDRKKAKDELELKIQERTRELRESEEKYRLLVENANEAVIVVQDKMYKLFNKKALELYGYSKEEFISIPFSELVHPDDRAKIIERYEKRTKGEKVPANYEHRIIPKDGSIKWVSVSAVTIPWESKPAALALLTDITQRKRMEQDLKAYAQKITRVQEEERKRIAFELHDDTAQYLALVKLEIDSLIHSGKIQDQEILKKLEYLEKDAGRAVDDVRRYSHELRPGVLEHLGIVAALEQIADDINKLKQIEVALKVEGIEPEMSEEVKLGFFRIAQEALNNCRKHAKAPRAIVSLRFHGNRIEMVVSDNGTGFDVNEAATRSSLKGSLGLISMQERARLIEADLKIDSKLGVGTTVTTEISI